MKGEEVMERDSREGDIVTTMRGTITEIKAREQTSRAGRSIMRGARICVGPLVTDDSKDYHEEFYYEVPETHVSRLRIGQEVAVEIRVLK